MGDIAAFFLARQEKIFFQKNPPLPLFPEKKMVGSYWFYS